MIAEQLNFLRAEIQRLIELRGWIGITIFLFPGVNHIDSMLASQLHLSFARVSIDRMLAYCNGRLRLGSVLLQPLRYELLYVSLARSNVSATVLLCELGKVKNSGNRRYTTRRE